MTVSDLLRYGVWGVVALTANANRRYYHMRTTWLPHLLTNSLTLLLPDAARALLPRRRVTGDAGIVEHVLVTMVRDNDEYVSYVTPLALGYILSHPRFNIFKGDWAEIRLGGFGLDALPHAATGFALTALVHDTLEAACQYRGKANLLVRLTRLFNTRPALTSLGILSVLTFIWEYGEYRVHNYELAQRGDISQINMMWSVRDTANDVTANLLGWALAALLRKRRAPTRISNVLFQNQPNDGD